MSLLLIVIIVVVVVVLLLLFLMRKKKPKQGMDSPRGPSSEYNSSLGQQGEQTTGPMAPQPYPEEESPPLSDEEPIPPGE
jgi:hypothetical protein